MANFNKFNAFPADLAGKVHNLGADTLKVMLSNTLPTAANAVRADITEIAAGNGYVAGGAAASLLSAGQVGGLYTLKLNNPSFTGAGGAIATFQYAVLYNSTAPSGNLLGWYDYGAPLVITPGNIFTVQFDAINGVITLT